MCEGGREGGRGRGGGVVNVVYSTVDHSVSQARWGLETAHPSVGVKYVLTVEIFPVIPPRCFPTPCWFSAGSQVRKQTPVLRAQWWLTALLDKQSARWKWSHWMSQSKRPCLWVTFAPGGRLASPDDECRRREKGFFFFQSDFNLGLSQQQTTCH